MVEEKKRKILDPKSWMLDSRDQERVKFDTSTAIISANSPG
jgi:hypothetical protein